MASRTEFQKVQPSVYTLGLTLASGATSASADIGGAKLIGMVYPSGMPNTSLAVLRDIGGTFYPVTDSNGVPLALTVATGTATYAYFNPVDVASLDGKIQFTSASAAGGDRALTLVLRAL